MICTSLTGMILGDIDDIVGVSWQVCRQPRLLIRDLREEARAKRMHERKSHANYITGCTLAAEKSTNEFPGFLNHFLIASNAILRTLTKH
jgi:hypothetical protein